MPETVTLQEAQAHLAELIAELNPGEQVVITNDGRPIARLTTGGLVPNGRGQRQPGSALGSVVILVEDDEYLADFQDYMR